MNRNLNRQGTKPPRRRAEPVPKPIDVIEQVWDDWQQLRKAKRAPVTSTVVAGARVEAAKAGMTLEAFLQLWCIRGSQGLQAEWLKPSELPQGKRLPAANTHKHAAAAATIFDGVWDA